VSPSCKKIGCLFTYAGSIFSKQQNFENIHEAIKNLIKIVGSLVLPQGLVPEHCWVEFPVDILGQTILETDSNVLSQKLSRMTYKISFPF
jgi:hypothetical protein